MGGGTQALPKEWISGASRLIIALASGQPGEHDKAAYRRCVSAGAISIWRRATSAPLSRTAYQSARRLDPGPPIRGGLKCPLTRIGHV